MSNKNIVISKETTTRLLHDVKHVMKNPLTENGIYYAHDDEDMLKGYALIIGPSDTPYFGGNFFFEFHYPKDYPHSPPHVLYCTNGEMIRFNPNIIEYKVIDIAILKILQKKSDIYPEQFLTFYPYVKENFLKNKDALKKYIEDKATTQPEENIKTSMYNMSVNINYKRLLSDFDMAISNT